MDLSQSFAEHSVAWVLVSSIVGGFVGATLKFVFETYLPGALTARKEVLQTTRKYMTPILLAVDELRTRVENMILFIDRIEAEEWLNPRRAGYYFESTLFDVAQLFGWIQILRREVVYLDLARTSQTRRFQRFLIGIQKTLTKPDLIAQPSASAPELSDDKWIYTLDLVSLGDAMIVRDGTRVQTMDYNTFRTRILRGNDPYLENVVRQLMAIFADLTKDDPRFLRVIALHSYLNAFVDGFDPNHDRTIALRYHWDMLAPAVQRRLGDDVNSY